jgi:hypothetical protein
MFRELRLNHLALLLFLIRQVRLVQVMESLEQDQSFMPVAMMWL